MSFKKIFFVLIHSVILDKIPNNFQDTFKLNGCKEYSHLIFVSFHEFLVICPIVWEFHVICDIVWKSWCSKSENEWCLFTPYQFNRKQCKDWHSSWTAHAIEYLLLVNILENLGWHLVIEWFFNPFYFCQLKNIAFWVWDKMKLCKIK